MTYEDIVFDYNNRALDARTWDMISDRERIEFALSLAGKVEKQEPVAWSRLDTAKSVITENEDIKRGWDLDGLPFKCLFDSPQPCPECEVNEAIGAGNTDLIEMLQAECASKQAKIDALMLEYCPDEMTAEQLVEWGEHQAPAECPECDEKQSAIDVWEGRYADKTAECEKMKAERDELAAQNQVLRNMVSEVRDPMDMSELPDLSTGILNRVRAEVAERCAEVCDVHATGWKASPGCNPMAGFIASSNCATDIRALAADMEAK